MQCGLEKGGQVPKYKIEAREITRLYVVIEAPSIEDAYQQFEDDAEALDWYEFDGGDYEFIDIKCHS